MTTLRTLKHSYSVLFPKSVKLNSKHTIKVILNIQNSKFFFELNKFKVSSKSKSYYAI